MLVLLAKWSILDVSRNNGCVSGDLLKIHIETIFQNTDSFLFLCKIKFLSKGLLSIIFRFLQRTRTSLVICTTQLKRQVIRERKIFSQFIIITTCFLVFDTSLIVISYLNNPSKWFGLFVSTAYILNCSVNGWVYLSMNQFIRGEVRRMFQRMLRKRNSKIDSDEYKVKQASVLEIVWYEKGILWRIPYFLHLAPLEISTPLNKDFRNFTVSSNLIFVV